MMLMPAAIPEKDVQFLRAREFQIAEIAWVFGMPVVDVGPVYVQSQKQSAEDSK